MLKRKANLLVEQAIYLNKNHIIMEDLGEFARSFTKSEEFLGFKYSRLIKLLNIADLKNIVTSIANKRGINVSFIHAPFTSQSCKCGHISKNNRTNQEIFKCTECDCCMNADQHSAIMITDRVRVDVLRELMLVKVDNHFVPKRMSRNKIKSILYDYYTNVKVTENEQMSILYCS